jgi:predicted nucleic acid-binding protein
MPITIDVLLDTNILTGLAYDAPSQLTTASEACVKLLEQGKKIGTTVNNLAEFWSVSTRPSIARGLGLSIPRVRERLQFLEDSLTIFSESQESFDIWKELVIQQQVQGKQVHDTRLAAIMMKEGIGSILTFNTGDFTRFPGISVLHPAQVLARKA